MAQVASMAARLPSSTRDRLILATSTVIVAALLIAAGLFVYHAVAPTTTVTAYFSETIGVYPGSTVRILGVPVGTVNSVTPDGTRVKVTMTLNSGVPVPANAGAVVISPSVVADRYIQLTPPYTHGAKLQSGAVIPVTRTMVPVEVDEVYSSLAKLANALGPNGANSKGALSSLIKTGAANLSGNGQYLRAMLTEFGGLSKTLGGSANNLYASIVFLQRFTTMLKNNDGQVRLAENQLADVSGFLANDRTDLAAALKDLAIALNQVKGFISDNRSLIDSNVSKLASLTSILSRERDSLAQALDDAPLAADNLVNAYDATRHTLDGRGDLNEFSMGQAAKAFDTADSQPGVAPGPIGTVAVPASLAGELPPLPLPPVGPVYGTPEAILAGGHQ
jgi:phospholipid/cholesterol/gamma-HCH transport system substrate-binding protein